MSQGFQVIHRNFGHWDICSTFDGRKRLFRIRGQPGSYIVFDERESPYPITKFATVSACMMYICEILMYENLQLAGSNPTVVDQWGNPVSPLTCLADTSSEEKP